MFLLLLVFVPLEDGAAIVVHMFDPRVILNTTKNIKHISTTRGVSFTSSFFLVLLSSAYSSSCF